MNAFDFVIHFFQFWSRLFDPVVTKLNTLLATIFDNHHEVKEILRKMDSNVQAKIDELKAENAAQSAASAKVLGEIKATVQKLKDAQETNEEAVQARINEALAANNAEVAAELQSVLDADKAVSAAIAELDAQVEDEPVVVE
jgi:response regulator of citrate/malate metabolism